MKRVVRCGKCSIAARTLGVGFTNPPELLCTERSGTVDEDDGCTFGVSGTPRTGASGYEVSISDHEAVYGHHR